ncbi:MAG: ROK family protein [Eubacteriales bacterium]|nr:ROK family protein [Eubacteriales bacterium]
MKTMVLDIGGTAIKSAVYEDGSLIDIQETPTEAWLGGNHVVKRAEEILFSYKKKYSFDRIGISTAGQVDSATGTIIYANKNIPGYTGTKLKNIFEEDFCLPTAVENDVNAAAIGEAVFGAGQNKENFACLTYGTGVGGAMFLRGSLYSGSSYSAGEFGAIVTHPEDRCPQKDMFSGCYEQYASVTALVRRAKELDPSLSDGRILFRHLGEPSVAHLIDEWIMEIVYGLVTITHMLNPSCIILGGGIMEQDYVLEHVQKKLYENIMPSFRNVKIKKAALGNRAGMLGAAVIR